MNRSWLVAGILFSGALAQEVAFKHYCNARFGFCIDYPNALVMQTPPDNDDGQTFKSRDGLVKMLVYGSYNSLQEKLETRFNAESTSSSTRKVTYRFYKPDAFVISGIENKKIFFEKVLFRDDAYKTFLIFYPVVLKKRYDPITAKISNSFKHSQYSSFRIH